MNFLDRRLVLLCSVYYSTVAIGSIVNSMTAIVRWCVVSLLPVDLRSGSVKGLAMPDYSDSSFAVLL